MISLAKRIQILSIENQVYGLIKCDALNWWNQIKRITGQKAKFDLTRLAKLHCDGNI